MDQQQQVLKENKKDANQDIVLWLNSAEVSQSASKIIQCSCLPAPCWCINITRLLLTLASPLLPKQVASIGEATASTTDPSMQVVEELEVEEVVEKVVELVKVVEELREPFSWKFTRDCMTKSNNHEPPTSTDCSLWIEVHYYGLSAVDDGLSLPQPDFSETAQRGYYSALSAADGKRQPEKTSSLLPQEKSNITLCSLCRT
jgi:hypothetical protein